MPIERTAMTQKLADYLRADSEPHGRGGLARGHRPSGSAHGDRARAARLPTPTLVFQLLDLPLFDAQTTSEVPHNACYDAMALRDYVMRTDH